MAVVAFGFAGMRWAKGRALLFAAGRLEKIHRQLRGWVLTNSKRLSFRYLCNLISIGVLPNDSLAF